MVSQADVVLVQLVPRLQRLVLASTRLFVVNRRSVPSFRRKGCLCVGIDIAKLKFDVAVLVGSKWRTRQYDNNATGFAGCLRWVQSLAGNVPLHICM